MKWKGKVIFASRLLLCLFSLMILAPQFGFAQQAPSSSPAPGSASTDIVLKPPPPNVHARNFHEDWTSVSLDTSLLPAVTPALTQTSEGPDGKYTLEFWRVGWRPADPIDVYVVLPKGVTKPPVILYLYSFPSTTNRFAEVQWCEDATSGGYAAVGFVSALTGYRLDHRHPKEWFVSELQESLVTSAHDVQMILNFLAQRGGLDLDNLGMYAEGSGASIAILAAAADPRLKAIEALDPWGDWPTWLAKSPTVPDDERPKYTTADFLAKVAPLDPVAWLSKVKSQGLRIDMIDTDVRLPEASRTNIEAAAPASAEVDEFGDGHAFVFNMKASGQSFGWLKDQLRPGHEPAAPVKDKSQSVHYYPPAAPGGMFRPPSDKTAPPPAKP